MKKKKVHLFFAMVLMVGALQAQVKSKSTGGSWNNVGTWENGAIPTTGDDVEINGSVTFNGTAANGTEVGNLVIKGTLLFNSAATSLTVKNLNIESTGVLNAFGGASGTSGKTIIVKGNLVNNGTVDFSRANTTTLGSSWSTLVMGEAGTATSISNTGTFEAVRQLIIDNSNGVTLNSPLSVSGCLNLRNGIFNNGNYLTLDRTNTGTSTSTPTQFYIQRSQLSSLSVAPNLGTNNLTSITYSEISGTAASITEGHEIPVSRDIYSLIIENSGGVIINDDLMLRSSSRALILNSGIVTLPTDKTLTINSNTANSIVSEGTSNSYVQGGGIALNVGGTKINRNVPLGSNGFNRNVILTGVSGTGIVRYSLKDFQQGTTGDGNQLSEARMLEALPLNDASHTFERIGMSFSPDDHIGGNIPDNIAHSLTANGVFTSLGSGSNTSGVINSPTGEFNANGYFVLALNSTTPVELLAFKVEKKENTVLISWQTASETNNNYFAVERSVDGREFTEIKRVQGQENSSVTRYYSVTDNNPSIGDNYYRLIHADLDGKLTVLDTKTLKFFLDANTKVTVFPNPVKGKVNIRVQNYREKSADIKLIGLDGRVIYHVKDVSLGLDSVYSFPTGAPAGVYILHVTGKQFSESTKVLIN